MVPGESPRPRDLQQSIFDQSYAPIDPRSRLHCMQHVIKFCVVLLPPSSRGIT